MLCGATMSGLVIAISYILKELQYVNEFYFIQLYLHEMELSRENKDKVEIYLAFGATRIEACRPIAIQALKLALTPPINSMR
jgi:ABC-type iron transport system FetAB permease component